MRHQEIPESLKSIWQDSESASDHAGVQSPKEAVQLMDVLGRDSSGFASAFGSPLSEHPFAADTPNTLSSHEFETDTSPGTYIHAYRYKVVNEEQLAQATKGILLPPIVQDDSGRLSSDDRSQDLGRAETPDEIKQYRGDPLGFSDVTREFITMPEPFIDDYATPIGLVHLTRASDESKGQDDGFSPFFQGEQNHSPNPEECYASLGSRRSSADDPCGLTYNNTPQYQSARIKSSVSSNVLRTSTSTNFHQRACSLPTNLNFNHGMQDRSSHQDDFVPKACWTDAWRLNCSPLQHDHKSRTSSRPRKVDNFNHGGPKLPHVARFFVIKSFSMEDVHQALLGSVWASTARGNERLDSAWKDSRFHDTDIFLFFSVNGSGQFCAVGKLASGLQAGDKQWLGGTGKWRGHFNVEFLYFKDVPNALLRGFRVAYNAGKSVVQSRDVSSH